MLHDPTDSLRKASTDDERLALFAALEKQSSSRCPIPMLLTGATESSKSSLVQLLLENLEKDLWNEQITLRALETLKVLGRDKKGCDALFSKEGIHTLVKLGGLQDKVDTRVSREALKCIANCLVLDDTTRDWLEAADAPVACIRLLQLDGLSMEAQFLVSRILFFAAAARETLVEQLLAQGIAEPLQRVLSRNVAALKSKEPFHDPFNPSSVLSEALKLHYTLIKYIQEKERNPEDTAELLKQINGCLTPILCLVLEIPSSEPFPLVPPHSHAIHSLMLCPSADISLAWKEQPSTWQDAVQRTAADDLISLLEKSIEHLAPDGDSAVTLSSVTSDPDAALASLMFAVRNLLGGLPWLKSQLTPRLLPDQSDRKQPVHVGNRLSARLVRMITASAMLGNAGKAVGELLFSVCDEDATKLVRNIGYGNAVGFLMDKKIAVEVPEGCEDESEGNDINPITGQYRSSEHDNGPSLAEMTDEEKEREAEKLFVLFERLKKTGVVDFENPIAKAMRENHEQLQKLDLSSDDED